MWRVWRVELLANGISRRTATTERGIKLGGQVGGRHAGTLEGGPRRLRLVALRAQPALGTQPAPLGVCRRVLAGPSTWRGRRWSRHRQRGLNSGSQTRHDGWRLPACGWLAAPRRAWGLDAAAQAELIRRAQERGYLELRDSRRVVYRCRRQREQDWADPEEQVRAAVFAWLILEREYPATGIDVEVTVPRRTPSAHADLVVYEDDACRVPYLVVETKARGLNEPAACQAVEQAFGNATSLRARYALYDNADESRLFDVANFPGTERVANCLGPREALGTDYGRARAFRLIAKLHDERWAPDGQPRRFQVGAGEHDVSVGNRVRGLYADAQRQDPTISLLTLAVPAQRSIAPFWVSPIQLPDAKIREVVQTIQQVALRSLDSDALGTVFERFFSPSLRGGLGQYLATVPAGMTRYRLGDVVIRREEEVVPAQYPDEAFVTLTLTREGGLEPRAAGEGVTPIDWHGASFNPGGRWFRARTDNLIISRIDLWQGCAAIIPPEFDGALVTREFGLFQVREDKLRPDYLKLLLRTEYFRRAIRAIAAGQSHPRRTQDDDCADPEIFLPGADVQDRIVHLGQDRERAVRADTRDLDRLVGEVERCVRGELSADELLAAAGGSASEDAAAS